MTADDRRFLFLLTYGRSGSTVVARLIGGHPGVVMRGENANMLFHLWKAVQAAEKTASKTKRREIADDPWHGCSNVDPEAISRDLANLFLDRVLVPGPEAKVVGFKEIRHTPAAMSDEDFDGYVGFLTKAFAPARIVFLSRNPEDVMKSGWWKNMRPDRVRDLIAGADARFERAAERLPEAIHVRFEDIAGDEAARRALFSHIGVDYDPSVAAAALARKLTHLQEK